MSPPPLTGNLVRVTHLWVQRPDAYHQHDVEYSSGGRVPVLVHRHGGGGVSHTHRAVESGPNGTHAVDVVDLTPADDIAVGAHVVQCREGIAGVRRRQAEMDAAL